MTRHSEYDGYFLKTQLSQDKASLTLDFLVNPAVVGSRASHGITANSKQDAVCTFSGTTRQLVKVCRHTCRPCEAMLHLQKSRDHQQPFECQRHLAFVGFESTVLHRTLWFIRMAFTGHFTWALSLMVLFSGRGYWQELVESLIWVHCQLQVVPSIQPRALSITMDRATGIIHFLGGGIGVSWAFTVGRSLLAQAFRKLCADRRAKIYFACFWCLQFSRNSEFAQHFDLQWMFPSFSSVDLSSETPKIIFVASSSRGKSAIFEKFLEILVNRSELELQAKMHVI